MMGREYLVTWRRRDQREHKGGKMKHRAKLKEGIRL